MKPTGGGGGHAGNDEAPLSCKRVRFEPAGPPTIGRKAARPFFALAGLALALAVGVGVPWLARTSLFLEVVVVAVTFVGLGWLVGRRVDALTKDSLADPMTSVGNRRHWEARMAIELDRAVSSRMPLSVVLVDVDNLKKLNDEHGHRCGDRALTVVADVLLATCRSRDVVARVGGDEFAILLPRTRASEAEIVAVRIRSALARRRATLEAPLGARLTVSMGIADLDAIREPRADLLFATADEALYSAKRAGRDRAHVPGRAAEGAPLRSGEMPCLPASAVIRLDERRRTRARSGRV